MAIRNFTVGPMKGLRLASADNLPNLVVVAGPNGSGKSTLLHQLWERRGEFMEPGTEVTYVGPHRPWRKSTLSVAHLYQLPHSYHSYLGMGSLPGWPQIVPPGLQFVAGQPRLPDSVDEAFSMVKYSIAQIEQKRLAALQRIYEEHEQQIPAGALPDIYQPLRTLTTFLLPHLQFRKVEYADPNNVRVLFTRVDGNYDDLIDIDELSSGEKAVVGLFLPFLEPQIESLLGTADVGEVPLPTALIDEPDIHLHPTLQVSLIDYLRDLASTGQGQFIITTHSPTILDSLRDDELYLVAPVASVASDNQFIQVASSEERLEAIRSLTGSTYLVTRCRPIVYVEGEPPEAKAASDQRLTELLIPEAAGWVLVPVRGRKEAEGSAVNLRAAATEHLPGIPVFALVDADQDEAPVEDFAVHWPVAMIENLLLDVDAVWDLLAPHREHLSIKSADDVAKALSEIAQELREDEIRLRCTRQLGRVHVSIDARSGMKSKDVIDEARSRLDQALSERGGEDAIDLAIDEASREVDLILEEGRALERFRGKEILDRFKNRYCQPLAMSRKVFMYEVAQRARTRPRLRSLVGQAVAKIARYVPRNLVPSLEAAAQHLAGDPHEAEAIEALASAQRSRAAWEEGRAAEEDLATLRIQVFSIARRLSELGAPELANPIREAGVQLGDALSSSQ